MASEKDNQFSDVIEIGDHYWMYDSGEQKLFHVKEPPKEKKKGLFAALRGSTITVLDFVMMPMDKWDNPAEREKFITDYIRRISGKYRVP